MKKLISHIQANAAKFTTDVKGATAIEYGLIAAGVAVGISVVVFTFGADLSTLFTDMSTELKKRPA